MNDTSSIAPDQYLIQPCSTLRLLGGYLIILWFLGVTFNGKILWIFIQKRQLLRSSSNIFIFALILADAVAILIEVPISVISTVFCRWFFGNIGCLIEAISAFFTACSNLYIFVLISLDRLYLIEHPHCRKLFTAKRAFCSVGICYVLAIFWVALPVFGWSYYDFEGTRVSCSIRWQNKSLMITSYLVAIFFGVFLIPLVIVIITNLKIIRHIHSDQYKKRVQMFGRSTRLTRRLRVEQKVTQTILMVIGGFLICWFPYALMIFIGGFINPNLISPLLATSLALFAKTSFVTNSMIYVMRNQDLRSHLQSSARPRIRTQAEIDLPSPGERKPTSLEICYENYHNLLKRPLDGLLISITMGSSRKSSTISVKCVTDEKIIDEEIFNENPNSSSITKNENSN